MFSFEFFVFLYFIILFIVGLCLERRCRICIFDYFEMYYIIEEINGLYLILFVSVNGYRAIGDVILGWLEKDIVKTDI